MSDLTTWSRPFQAALVCGVLLALGMAGCAPLPSIAGERSAPPAALEAGFPSPTAIQSPTSGPVHLAERGSGVAQPERIPLIAEGVVSFSLTPQGTTIAIPPGQPAPLPSLSPPVPTATPTPTPTSTPTPRPSPTRSPTATPPPTPTTIPAPERQQMFEEVWQTVNTHYLYADFHGLDWEGVRTRFAPMVAAAESNEEFYTLLAEMVGLLGDHHSRFVAPGDVIQEDEQHTGVERRVGIGAKMATLPGGAVIQQVLSGGPAEQAGLQAQDQIVAVDGVSCAASSCPDICGPSGTHVRLTIVRQDNQVRDVVLTRRPVNARIAPVVRRLEGDIGYLSIPSLWVNDMTAYVSGALTDLVVEKPLRGLILDLRGDPGGWRNVLVGVLSHFVRGEVGVFFDRHQTTPLVVNEGSGPDLRGLPLVVLIDDVTASYAEVLAGVLQTEAGAFVIGVASSGNTETIYAYEVDGGARLWLAQEGFRLRNGVNLEGQGVQPDLVMDLDWTRYSEEEDPNIREALRWLNE